MKKLLLTLALSSLNFIIFAQSWQDSVLTTSTQKVVAGATGRSLNPDEVHEWFDIHTISTDTLTRYHIQRVETLSKQCVLTGKQLAVITTYYTKPKFGEEQQP